MKEPERKNKTKMQKKKPQQNHWKPDKTLRKSKAKNLKQRKQHRKKEQRTNKTRIPYVGRPNQTLPSAKAQRCDANKRQIGFAHPSSHLSVYQKPIGRPIGLPLADCITVRQVAQPLIGLPMADWALLGLLLVDWLQSAHRRPTSYYFCNFL